MHWDLGLRGVGVLVGMSLAFGAIAQLVAGRSQTSSRRLWAIAATAFFVSGLITSEVLFGWATEEDLQPNIDGLSFDETLLFGLLAGIISVLVSRQVSRRRQGPPKAHG